MSKQYSLNRKDGAKIIKTAGFLVASTLITFLIDLIPSVDLGANYAWAIPLCNIFLVAVKKFIVESRED